MNYPKYTVDDAINNIGVGTEMDIKYNSKDYFICFKSDKPTTIGSITYFFERYILKKEEEGKNIIIEIKEDNNIFQEFTTPKELFENAIIEGYKLKDIWDDVEITWMAGFDEY